jgi:hypothetical protein
MPVGVQERARALFAQGEAVTVIVPILEQEFGIDLSYQSVCAFLRGSVRPSKRREKIIRYATQRACKSCSLEYTIENPAQVYCRLCCPTDAAYQRLKLYGLSHPDFEALLQKQRDKCALCETILVVAGETKLDIDHCHGTGKVRGLLCHKCNMMIGFLETGCGISKIDRIVSYLRGEQ